MKILRIKFLKKNNNNKTNFCLIKLTNDSNKEIDILANLIRRTILKNIM